RAIGMTRAEVIPTRGHPLVYAEWMGAPGRPTALLYGHYDVQPPDPLDLWTTPPFEPTLRDGKLYARGAVDDKGQVWMHVAEIEVQGPSKDLHSGHFGGTVENPANALCTIIAALKDADGRITIPGFYDKVRTPTDEERTTMRTVPFGEKGFIHESGSPEARGE